MEMENMHALKLLLTDNGWNWVTALCTMIFILFHFPCSTTCLTIKKETGSLKWTAARFYSSDSLRCSDMFYYFLFGETYRNRCMKIIRMKNYIKFCQNGLNSIIFCVIITVIVMRLLPIDKSFIKGVKI